MATTPRPRPTRHSPTWHCRALLLSLLLVPFSALPGGAQTAPPAITVDYVSATSVYVDAGRRDGLNVGDRLAVVRDGVVIAELEVAYVAEHSASCRVQVERRAVEQGDRVRVLARSLPPAEPSPRPPEPPPQEPPRPKPLAPAVGDGSAIDLTSRGRDAEAPWARLAGSVSLSWQQFSDGLGERDYDESTGRVSLNMGDIGGRDYDVRIRLRSRQINRGPDAASEQSDRLYEFALVHDPPEGRFSFLVGRLGANPFATLGYLDGFVGQVRVAPVFAVGAFYGSRPEIKELGFTSSGQKYGGYLKLNTRPDDEGFFAEVLIAGIGEYLGGEVDREYVAIESRLGSSRRWRFYQRAEIDVNSDWRKTAEGQAYQVSNLSLSGSYRGSDFFRLSISYDQRKPFRTLDTREIPEDAFDDHLREGWRLGLGFGKPRGWNGTATFGYRAQQGDAGATYSFAGSVYHTHFLNRNLLVSANFSGYGGDTAEGMLLTLQVRKYFRGGHDVGVTVGASTTTVSPAGGFAGGDRNNQWLRLQSTLNLPRRFYILGEIEIDSGDDLEGQRLILELGYRF